MMVIAVLNAPKRLNKSGRYSIMKWIEALKEWNTKQGGKWCIPKKGSPEYDAVKKIMGGGKAEEKKAPTPKKAPSAKKEEPKPKKDEKPKKEEKPDERDWSMYKANNGKEYPYKKINESLIKLVKDTIQEYGNKHPTPEVDSHLFKLPAKFKKYNIKNAPGEANYKSDDGYMNFLGNSTAPFYFDIDSKDLYISINDKIIKKSRYPFKILAEKLKSGEIKDKDWGHRFLLAKRVEN